MQVKATINAIVSAIANLLTCWLLSNIALAEQSTIITHRENEMQRMSLNTARAIFSMRLNQWPDGKSVIVFVMPDQSIAHQNFTKKKLSMFPHQLRRSWDRYIYSGIGVAPIEVANEADMLKKITITPGSVGYIDERLVNEHVRKIGIQ